MNINALAPFTVISPLGLLVIAIPSTRVLAWMFIPTVINPAAAGGDVLILHWMGKQPSDAVYEDHSDALTAYQSIS